MKQLIVNADDLGFSKENNDAIVECLFHGRITGISIMPSGQAFIDAAKILRDLDRRDVGVHLTLTGSFEPCCQRKERIMSLLGDDGKFLKDYTALLPRFLAGMADYKQIYREFRAQVEHVRKEGLNITHLDSHEHIHMFPLVMDIVLKVAEEFKIPYVRFTSEPFSTVFNSFNPVNFLKYSMLKSLSLFSRVKGRKTGVKRNDMFLGHFHSGNISNGIFRYMIDNMTDGIYEIAFHPAVISPGFVSQHPQYKNASKEFETLLKGSWFSYAEEKGVKLLAHREV